MVRKKSGILKQNIGCCCMDIPVVERLKGVFPENEAKIFFVKVFLLTSKICNTLYHRKSTDLSKCQ